MPDGRAVARTVDLDLCLVDRADETQARALLKALGGENVVIQGPPGTGKSQTITNMIAAALDRGKTILFVADDWLFHADQTTPSAGVRP